MSRKIPRGKGYDKAAVTRHWKQLTRDGISVTQYVKDNGLHLDTFMLAAVTHCPTLIHHSQMPFSQPCGYCQDVYWPSKKGTKWCSPKCGKDAGVDERYFG